VKRDGWLSLPVLFCGRRDSSGTAYCCLLCGPQARSPALVLRLGRRFVPPSWRNGVRLRYRQIRNLHRNTATARVAATSTDADRAIDLSGGAEFRRIGERPAGFKPLVGGARKQFARLERRIELGKIQHFGG